jgi:ATP-dependent Clp protease ATP-binding subunit ClpB
LADINQARSSLRAHWQLEKELIQLIRKMKEEIENGKKESDLQEREGNLGRVAELRYGVIIGLEKRLKEASQELGEIQKNQKMLKEEVDAEDIAEIVAKWTGIPVQRMLEGERTKLLHLEDRIHERLVNQEDAVKAVADAIRRSRAGLQDEKKPIGSFIFLGSTGVGKTELAKALAEFLFNDESAVVRIDMSEYMEKISVSRLIGAPPGYVGYEEGGQLTEAIRRKPYSIVLLDEIEKAHQEVFNVLLQVLDEGRLTDSKGRTVNFRNTIVIMTSNLGSHLIQERLENLTETNREEFMGELRVKLFEMLKQSVRPEFLNRIDEIILFKPLTMSELAQIVELQLRQVQKLVTDKNITLQFSPEAKARLATIGYEPSFGARPMKRIIQKYVINALSEKLLKGEVVEGDTVNVETDHRGMIVFTKKIKPEVHR